MARVQALVLLIAVTTAGCGGGESAPTHAQAGDADSAVPHLLTWSPPGASMQALVHGELRVNKAGCFALDRNVLVAPPGSEVVEAGNAIEVPRLGRVSIGDRISVTGGYLNATDLKEVAGHSECLDQESTAEFAILSP